MSLAINENSFGLTLTIDNYVLKVDNPNKYKFTLVKSAVGHFQHIRLITAEDLTEGLFIILEEIFELIQKDEDRQKRRAAM